MNLQLRELKSVYTFVLGRGGAMAAFYWYMFVWLIIVTAVDGSKKKGYAIDLNAFKCGDLDALTNIRWWYNWDSNFGDLETNSGCTINDKHLAPFVPMIWGYRSNYKPDAFIVDDRNEFVLGFNEPNHIHQSNLSPTVAAENWNIVEQAAANGNKLIVSPAAAPCKTPDRCLSDTKEWFDEFFRILCGLSNSEPVVPCRVDFLATHHYSCDPDSTFYYLSNLYETYNLKIWLTEFACPESTYEDEQLYYMETLLPMLEENDFIFRYAWFVHRRSNPDAFVTTAANLFKTGSSELTMLGKAYNDFGVQKSERPGVCRANKRR